MLTCPRCQFLAPAQALNCPKCHAPVAHLSPQRHTPYAGVTVPGPPVAPSRRSRAVALAAAVALVGMSGFLVGTQRTSSPDELADVPVSAARSDGWVDFRPTDGAFGVEFPAAPVRSEDFLPKLGRTVVRYDATFLGARFRVVQQPAPEYAPAYEIGKKLPKWLEATWPDETATVVISASGLSAKGDQIYDAVVTDTSGRHRVRAAMWDGSLLFAVVTTPSSASETADQIAAWRRFSESLGH